MRKKIIHYKETFSLGFKVAIVRIVLIVYTGSISKNLIPTICLEIEIIARIGKGAEDRKLQDCNIDCKILSKMQNCTYA